ncbi:MAG TPA: acyl-CoA thioesterase [Desulfobulbaceae bacterium]|nr:acyl-CoA thioesterase [Desulfobulbaceae bacterium]
MRPKPFLPEPIDPPFIRDQNSGLVWHRSAMRVLYVDTDRSQVVYHANYLRYFEFGRAEFMRDANYPYKQVEENGYVYPVIKTELSYHSPLRYDDLMYIHTRPAAIGLVKARFDYIITKAESGEISCLGSTEHCAIAVAGGKPVEIDARTLQLWRDFPK